MKAIGLYKALPIEDSQSLLDIDIPLGPKGKRDLVVQVKSIGVNPVDYKIRQRTQGELEQAKVLGWDVAGIVSEVGEETSLFKVGDEVYYAGDITRTGCNSEYHIVDERVVGLKPKNLSFDEAAAMPLTSITAWEALFERLNIKKDPITNKGKSVLIIGGAGGVGSIATQIAKQVAGLKVICTASREESKKWCLAMGASETINHKNAFKQEFEAKNISNVDYILCFNSMELHMQNMADVIKPQGKICTIVETPNNEPVNINIFQAKSVGILWELMFTKTIFQTDDMIEQSHLLNDVSKLLDNGTLVSTLTKSFKGLNAKNFRDAHQLLENENAIGKVVVGDIT
ncbi:MAG: zinc-binding alcohol dehydrogenase family protein [Saccharospirillaceae bacterium]|nr:zinc-binding alcohol dehydrogenase family protein [Pseudomonadales bacterium]NRB80432.1 zinc-binding alcohol dehydrogenase family protein [Saccharospirillaceae bacterium]